MHGADQMTTNETFHEGALTLEIGETDDAVRVSWLGKSIAREPGPFILRVLGRAEARSQERSKPLVLDFSEVGYMNSSTITPLIRMLDRTKRGEGSVRVLYRKGLRWQELNFAALEVFETTDHRIEIVGV
jgi:hypothetical protein